MKKIKYFSTLAEIFEVRKENVNKTYSKSFFLLTKIINTTSLSVIAGIISGLAVNIFTSDSIIPLHYLAILFLIITVFFIIVLIKLFEEFNEKYYAFKQDNINSAQPASPTQNWLSAISFDTGWKRFFYVNLIISFVCFSSAIGILYGANNIIKKGAEISKEQSQKDIMSISDSLFQLNSNFRKQNILIINLSDSIKMMKNQNKLFQDKILNKKISIIK